MSNGRDAGFTLLETIVALLVFAMVAGAMQLCLSGGWRNVRTVNLERVALQTARAEIASIGHESALVAGETERQTDDGFTIIRDVRLRVPDSGDETTQTPVLGYWVRVNVIWRDRTSRGERRVTLETLKIGRGE